MASKDAHLRQAAHNETFYNQLLDTEFLDWAVTTTFYSALHYVDAYLANKLDFHPLTHGKRTPWISRDSNLQHIYGQYERLKNQSEAARYRVKRFTWAEAKGLKENELEIIKSHISGHL